MLEEAIKKALPAPAAENPELVKKADVDAALVSLKDELKGEVAKLVADEVAKAFAQSREGVGRKGTVDNEPKAEDDPCGFLAVKAQAVREGTKPDYTVDEKQLAASLFIAYVQNGMKE